MMIMMDDDAAVETEASWSPIGTVAHPLLLRGDGCVLFCFCFLSESGCDHRLT